MTKAQVVAEFTEYVLPIVQKDYERDGRIDRPARREAWNNFTDLLCKQGCITSRQYDRWMHPRCCGG